MTSIDTDAWCSTDDGPSEFEVWPDNWSTLMVFLAMSTQWHRGGMDGVKLGLYYPSLPSVYEGVGIRKKDRPKVFEGLRCMERAALEAFVN